VETNHVMFTKKFEDEVNSSIKANVVKQLIKKNLKYPQVPFEF
jgi:hypothetical protein